MAFFEVRVGPTTDLIETAQAADTHVVVIERTDADARRWDIGSLAQSLLAVVEKPHTLERCHARRQHGP